MQKYFLLPVNSVIGTEYHLSVRCGNALDNALFNFEPALDSGDAVCCLVKGFYYPLSCRMQLLIGYDLKILFVCTVAQPYFFARDSVSFRNIFSPSAFAASL